MNILLWFVVLGVACGIGYILLIRRLGTATPFNSIYQGTADRPHEEAAGAGEQMQHSSNVQESHAHGGCCGITR